MAKTDERARTEAVLPLREKAIANPVFFHILMTEPLHESVAGSLMIVTEGSAHNSARIIANLISSMTGEI